MSKMIRYKKGTCPPSFKRLMNISKKKRGIEANMWFQGCIGAPVYWSGEPCSKGHNSVRYVEDNECMKCYRLRTDRPV